MNILTWFAYIFVSAIILYGVGEILEYYAKKIGKGYAEGKATVPIVITKNNYYDKNNP